MIIVSHNDLDGICAAAVAYRSTLIGKARDCRILLMDYTTRTPDFGLKKDEPLCILDFSFTPEEMEKILSITKNIIWIDHHRTAFEYPYNTPELAGVRSDKGSGCELTWEFFNPGVPAPASVMLVGDHDTWTFKYGDDTTYFHEGLEAFKYEDVRGALWDDLLGFSENLEKILSIGKTVHQYKTELCRRTVNDIGFETTIDGHKAYAMNFDVYGSEAFGDKVKDYEVLSSFCFNGNQWSISFYSETVDVSVIAKKYGGGGHKGASGCVVDELFFKKEGKDEKPVPAEA